MHRICAQIPGSAPKVVSGSTLRPYPCPPPLLGYAYTPHLTRAGPCSTSSGLGQGVRVWVAGKGASKGGGIVPWSCPLPTPTTHVRTMEENPAHIRRLHPPGESRRNPSPRRSGALHSLACGTSSLLRVETRATRGRSGRTTGSRALVFARLPSRQPPRLAVPKREWGSDPACRIHWTQSHGE